VSCSRQPSATAWSYNERAGIVRFGGEGDACFTIANPSLAFGTAVTVVELSTQRTLTAVVAPPTEACLQAANGQAEARSYRLVRFEGSAPPAPWFGIAIVRSSLPFKANASAAADIDGDGHDEFFRSCTSSEGVHFTIWSDRPLSGTLRWHRYSYLGYDVTPSCTPEEMRDP